MEVVTVQIGTGVELLMRSGVGARMLELAGGLGGDKRGYMFVSGLWISADEARVLEGEGGVMGGGGGGEGGAAARKTLEMMEYVLLRREFLCMCIFKKSMISVSSCYTHTHTCMYTSYLFICMCIYRSVSSCMCLHISLYVRLYWCMCT